MMLHRVIRATQARGTLLPRTLQPATRLPHLSTSRLALNIQPKRPYFVERPLHEMDSLEAMTSWVYDTKGDYIPFYSLLDNRVLLVFLRHYGDACTAHQLDTLAKYKEQILATNTNILLIGNGNPGRTEAFIRTNQDFFRCHFPGPIVEIFTDVEQRIYHQFGLKRGIWKSISPAYLNTIPNKTLSKCGYFQGDPWQLGGLFVIQENMVFYEHYSERAGDHANLDEVMMALRKLYELNQAVGEYVFQEGEKEGRVPPKIPEDAIIIDPEIPEHYKYMFPSGKLNKYEKERKRLAILKQEEDAKKPKRIWTKIAEKIFAIK